MDFRPLDDVERQKLAEALKSNAKGDDGAALLMNPKDTSFMGTTDQVTDEEVIRAIRSVPCHY